MKRKLILICTIIGVLVSCNTQTAKFEKSNPNSSLLWEISGNGLENPSYLFGTIHLIDKEDFFIPNGVKEALQQSEVIVMEIDLNIPMKDQFAMVQKSMIPDGKTLKDYLSEEDFQSLKSLCLDTIGISEKKFEKYIQFKPFFISGVILKEYYGKIVSYEKFLSKQLKKNKKEFMALETLEYQMSILDSISIEEQSKDMDADELISGFEQLVAAYQSQNLDEILAILKETEMDSEIEKNLLIKRNINWAEKLEPLMKNQRMFIAVGTAHLPGDQGLIKLLEEKGFTVKPI